MGEGSILHATTPERRHGHTGQQMVPLSRLYTMLITRAVSQDEPRQDTAKTKGRQKPPPEEGATPGVGRTCFPRSCSYRTGSGH